MAGIVSGDQPLGVLLLSAARHQGAFAEILSRQPGIQLIAVADEAEIPDWVREANRALAEKLDLPYIENLDEALARDDIDLVTLGSLYSRHGPLTIAALEAGKHVLSDKQPMGMSAEEAREVYAASQKAAAKGLKSGYIHHVVNPTVQRAKRAIDQGEIGQPRALFASAIVVYGPGEDENTDPLTRWGKGLHPMWWNGGELIHHGAYAIGVARYLMGSEINSVYGVLGGHFNRIHRDNGSEDLVTLSLGFENGGVATLVIGRPPNVAHPSYADEFVNVVGTKGAVTADWEKPSFLLVDSEQGLSRREMYGRRDTTELAVLDFLNAIKTGGEPVQGAKDGLAETTVLWAAYESARTGRVVTV
jgi:predicted dehydrogenase